jgi:predicted DNA-binding ribbon-helix-helix protein
MKDNQCPCLSGVLITISIFSFDKKDRSVNKEVGIKISGNAEVKLSEDTYLILSIVAMEDNKTVQALIEEILNNFASALRFVAFDRPEYQNYQ